MPPQTFLAPGVCARSSTTVARPAVANSRAAVIPAGPAPTTIASSTSSVTDVVLAFCLSPETHIALDLVGVSVQMLRVDLQPHLRGVAAHLGVVALARPSLLRQGTQQDGSCGPRRGNHVERHIYWQVGVAGQSRPRLLIEPDDGRRLLDGEVSDTAGDDRFDIGALPDDLVN